MNMIIDEYSFGMIKVAGREYTSDVIIYPERVDSSWWRQDGHLLVPEDLPDVLLDPPAILVIGTGYYGRMEVPVGTVSNIRSRGIQVSVAPTKDAVEDFNRLQRKSSSIVAALHLTC